MNRSKLRDFKREALAPKTSELEGAFSAPTASGGTRFALPEVIPMLRAAAQGSLISLTSVLFSALLSHLLFNDPFTLHTLFGGLLILSGAVTLSLRKLPSPPRF